MSDKNKPNGLGKRSLAPFRWFISGVSNKTSWEWLELLIVPVMLAGGAFLIDSQVEQRQEAQAEQRRIEQQQLAEDQRRQAILDGYFDDMKELLLERNLRNSTDDSEVRSVARAITTTTMKELGAERNGVLIEFLRESRLLYYSDSAGEITSIPILIRLQLGKVNLSQANLGEANLSQANLSQADLSEANLSQANLSQANLGLTNLSGANLGLTNLSGADLSAANLNGADLSAANLNGADLSEANLSQVHFGFFSYSYSVVLGNGKGYSGAMLATHDADLSQADLSGSNLSNVNLSKANLSNADLSKANLSSSLLIANDLHESKNLISEQLNGNGQPYLCGVRLPPNITGIDPNRDCDNPELPKLLTDRHGYTAEESQKLIEEARNKQWD